MTGAELAQLLVAGATLVSAIAGLVVAIRTSANVGRTHDLVNGASEALRQLREDKGHQEGLAEGAQQLLEEQRRGH